MHEAGELHLRVAKSIPAGHLEAAVEEGRRTGDGDEWLRTGPVKIFGDGALGSHTCHMSEPFAGEPGNTGIEVTAPPELERLIARASGAGIAVATHAIGDRANALVVGAHHRTRELWHGRLRHRIEHAQHLRDETITQMAALGLVASMQPVHVAGDLDLVTSLLPDPRLRSFAWRSMLDAGVPLAFGSDAPVATPDPFLGMVAALTRARQDGTPAGGWQPEQRLTRAEALAAYTAGSAYAMGEPWRGGVLAPGRFADLVVVDRDILGDSVESLRGTRVLTTVVGGLVRWSRGD